ncbi:MAG TPA: hypothetical protein IAB43_12335 [Candidatus Spyradocola merdavium]|nr:hypothetical protein [Candidatus Spyradocola merdavium]
MMKKLAAILALALAGALLLTGCVAAAPALDESQIDRPTVVVSLNGEALEATVEPEETAEASAAPTAEATAEPDENAIPEYAVLNTVPAGATLTLSGTHSSGITSVCYRFDGGQTTTVQGESVEVEVPAGAQLLELYVIGGNGIASQWAAYYLTAE